ncbi:DUF4250 domain-containing protein [Anaerocolumna xylanovorans]|uniref:DUF4250 domain-containing protein n=1 Tax=Anaerocolumna xylanovorans DSM 12503 TaxID=1121345 RepID=A0A1M7YH07_9FIRM|nr:DUF4250 domain-containing protein [Anaerocolumna xylanovorans]SHO51900.1 protein of unknown function [Anaerocolumna xylanovorans DSM 12503]
MALPKDPFILLSYINTQLRDHYKDLTELCKILEISEQDLKNRLNIIHYEYIPELNQFR